MRVQSMYSRPHPRATETVRVAPATAQPLARSTLGIPFYINVALLRFYLSRAHTYYRILELRHSNRTWWSIITRKFRWGCAWRLRSWRARGARHRLHRLPRHARVVVGLPETRHGWLLVRGMSARIAAFRGDLVAVRGDERPRKRITSHQPPKRAAGGVLPYDGPPVGLCLASSPAAGDDHHAGSPRHPVPELAKHGPDIHTVRVPDAGHVDAREQLRAAGSAASRFIASAASAGSAYASKQSASNSASGTDGRRASTSSGRRLLVCCCPTT